VPHVDPEAGFDLSPDGNRLAFSWNRTGQWEIYQISLDNPADLRQISGSPGAKFTPAYAPDGRRFTWSTRRKRPSISGCTESGSTSI
jgi:Tol biopolymer transport system component